MSGDPAERIEERRPQPGPAVGSRPELTVHAGRERGYDRADERPTPPAKRALDVVLAATGLLLSSPLWLLLAAAIRLEDGGPVFFSQQRVGKGGELFRSWKFRSMVPADDGDRTPQQDEPDEDEITRVGKLMRATALDELPQLWNILKGDMSFVGPRALPPVETTADGETVEIMELPKTNQRQSVRPGLTGLAQVRAPRDATHRQKFRFDLLYAESRSLWLDVKLIALSLWISVTGSWKQIGHS